MGREWQPSWRAKVSGEVKERAAKTALSLHVRSCGLLATCTCFARRRTPLLDQKAATKRWLDQIGHTDGAVEIRSRSSRGTTDDVNVTAKVYLLFSNKIRKFRLHRSRS